MIQISNGLPKTIKGWNKGNVLVFGLWEGQARMACQVGLEGII